MRAHKGTSELGPVEAARRASGTWICLVMKSPSSVRASRRSRPLLLVFPSVDHELGDAYADSPLRARRDRGDDLGGVPRPLDGGSEESGFR